MNYVNPALETPQVLALNCKVAAGASIDWTLTKEGNDDESFSFSSPSANFTLTDMSYYQAFSCDFFAEGIDLSSEHSYVLRGAVNGSKVYHGKIFVTERDLDNYSVNESAFTLKSQPTNNFVILD